MKVIIDIDDSYYKVYKTSDKYNIDLSIGELAIKNGIQLPDNATNGDVIMAMFDCMVIDISDGEVCVEKIYFPFDEDWWNAPYKEG